MIAGRVDGFDSNIEVLWRSAIIQSDSHDECPDAIHIVHQSNSCSGSQSEACQKKESIPALLELRQSYILDKMSRCCRATQKDNQSSSFKS